MPVCRNQLNRPALTARQDKSDGIRRPAPTLPLDVLVLVLSNLPRNDTATLSAFLRSSKLCYTAAAPFLYRHVRFGSATHRHALIDMQRLSSNNRLADTTFRPGQGRQPPKLRTTRKNDLLKLIRTLSIERHDDWWCANLPKLPLPDLHTLRLNLSYGTSNLIHPENQPQSCVTFWAASPRRLVLRDLHLSPKPIPPFEAYAGLIQRTTDELVLVLGETIKSPPVYYQDFFSDMLDRLPECPARKVTVIFWTKYKHIEYARQPFVPPRHSLRGFESKSELWRDLAGVLIVAFARWVLIKPRRLVFVNTGSFGQLPTSSTDHTEEEVQNVVEQQLKEGILNNTPKGDPERSEVEETLGSMEFITMKRYLGETDWEGVFDEKEVRPWLQ